MDILYLDSSNRETINPNPQPLLLLEVLLNIHEKLICIGSKNSKEKIWYPPHASRVDAEK